MFKSIKINVTKKQIKNDVRDVLALAVAIAINPVIIPISIALGVTGMVAETVGKVIKNHREESVEKDIPTEK